MSSYKTGGSQYKTWFSSAQQETYLVSDITARDALDKTVMAPGSSCYLDDGTAKWMLGSDIEWHEWDMGGGGGSELPSVTTDDNGKVLGVADGAWTAVENKPMPFRSIIKLDDYTYEVWYDAIDYDFAQEYFEREPNINVGGCSAAFKNGKFIRNYDWKYDNTAQFIVHVDASHGRHATIGICGGIAELTPEFVDSGAYSDLYKVLPFYMQDGFNDVGLSCCMNVVPRDKGDNRYPVPVGQTEDVCGIMLVRYMLDNMNTVADMETKIPQVGMWFPDSLHEQGYELHYFAADIGQNTTVLEYVENEPVFHDIDRMTNFYIDGVTLNDDGTVYTPYTQDDTHNAMDTNGVTENGSGLERWNIITDAFNNDTYADIADLCPELFFTKAYTITEDANVWYTEFVGINGLTCATPYDEYADTVAAARARYEERTREDEEPTWHTVHSTVYDLDNGTMHVIMQEGMSEYDGAKPADLSQYATIQYVDTKQDKNIGAENAGKTLIADENGDLQPGEGGGSVQDVVKTVEQELTEDEKMQARKNQGLYYSEWTPVEPIVWKDSAGLTVQFVHPVLGTMYKVSDTVFSLYDLIGGKIDRIADGEITRTLEINEDTTGQYDMGGAVDVRFVGGFLASGRQGMYFGGTPESFIIPEDGTYACESVFDGAEWRLYPHGIETVTPIEKRYIRKERDDLFVVHLSSIDLETLEIDCNYHDIMLAMENGLLPVIVNYSSIYYGYVPLQLASTWAYALTGVHDDGTLIFTRIYMNKTEGVLVDSIWVDSHNTVSYKSMNGALATTQDIQNAIGEIESVLETI